MSNRYRDRVESLIDYLDTALNTGTTDTYYPTAKVSEANGTGAAKRILLVRWNGMTNDMGRGLSKPDTDNQDFIIIGVPVASTDDEADEECDEIAEDVIDAIRSTTSYAVLGSDGGATCGWRVTGARKGPNRSGQLVIEVDIEVLIEEDRT